MERDIICSLLYSTNEEIMKKYGAVTKKHLFGKTETVKHLPLRTNINDEKEEAGFCLVRDISVGFVIKPKQVNFLEDKILVVDTKDVYVFEYV